MKLFENKIVSHPDYFDPGPCEAIARMAIAHVETRFQPHMSEMKLEARIRFGRECSAFLEAQQWLSADGLRTTRDILGDILHSDNHQNQDVMDNGQLTWWVLSK